MLCAFNTPGGDCADAESGKPWTHNPECTRWRMRTLAERDAARIAELEAENAELHERVAELEEVIGLIGFDGLCDRLHHRKGDRHTFGESCPVEARIAALAEGEGE